MSKPAFDPNAPFEPVNDTAPAQGAAKPAFDPNASFEAVDVSTTSKKDPMTYHGVPIMAGIPVAAPALAMESVAGGLLTPKTPPPSPPSVNPEFEKLITSEKTTPADMENYVKTLEEKALEEPDSMSVGDKALNYARKAAALGILGHYGRKAYKLGTGLLK